MSPSASPISDCLIPTKPSEGKYLPVSFGKSVKGAMPEIADMEQRAMVQPYALLKASNRMPRKGLIRGTIRT